jgi:hypothetical protein
VLSTEGTLCSGDELTARQWIAYREHYGPLSGPTKQNGTVVYSHVANVDTHLKKSEVKSQFLPEDKMIAVPKGARVVLAAKDSVLEGGNSLFTCADHTCMS